MKAGGCVKCGAASSAAIREILAAMRWSGPHVCLRRIAVRAETSYQCVPGMESPIGCREADDSYMR